MRVIQCNIRNITEQRLAEDQVRKLSLVVEQSPVAIVIANLAGEIEYVNAALLRNSGYRQDELIGRQTRMLQSSAMSPLTFADLGASIGQGEIWRGEFCSQRKDGSEFAESAIVAPIRRPDGTTSHYVTITEDITERKRDALELDRHRHALEALVDTRTQELAVAKLAAEAANIAKSAFLANMSHEIRTPLAAIMGLTYLIRRTQVTPQQADWLSKLEVAGAHLLELINAILDLSKIEAGKLALESTQVNAAGIAASVVSILSERALAKHLNLLIETHPLPQGLVGDATRLQQALLNYAGNAVKFTAAGSVTLRMLVRRGNSRHGTDPLRGAGHRHGHRAGGTGALVHALRAGRQLDHTAARRNRAGSCDRAAAGAPDGRGSRCREHCRRGQHLLVHGPVAQGNSPGCRAPPKAWIAGSHPVARPCGRPRAGGGRRPVNREVAHGHSAHSVRQGGRRQGRHRGGSHGWAERTMS